jgi:transposase
MTKVPRLSEAVQKQILRQAHARRWDGASTLRLRAVLAVARGRSRREVAAVMAVAPSTVVRAVERFVDGGFDALRDRREGNGARKVDEDYLDRLFAVLGHRADDFGWQRPTWTRELLALTVAQMGCALVAVCTVGRALRQIGARRGRPKPTVDCPWPPELRDKVLRRLRRLENTASDEEPVVFADEVDIHLNPKIGLDWMNRGAQREVLTPGNNVKHYLAGALDSRSRRLVWVDGTRKNSALFCRLLDALVAAYPGSRVVHVILDNYSIHSSRLVQRKLVELGGRIRLHFLPPYCPDHNRIEREWQELHANVTRNHRCPDMLALLVHVVLYLMHRNDRRGVKPALRAGLPVAA